MTPVHRSLAGALVTAVAATALLGACAEPGTGPTGPESPAAESTAAEPTSSAPSAEEPTMEPSTDPSAAPADSPLVTAAAADLASRLGVDEASVELVSLEPVTWSDGSLGCARKGMSYTQALVEGSRIVLRADGTVHEYHAGAGGEPFPCPRPTQ